MYDNGKENGNDNGNIIYMYDIIREYKIFNY